MAFLSVICVVTREWSIKKVAELKVNLSYLNMHIFFTFVNMKFEIFIFPVPGIDGILWRSSEIWVFNPAGSHIFLKNTLKLNYDSLISASKNYFWLLVKIAFLYEVSVSACRVLHSWEQRNDAAHGGDKDIS